MEGVRRVISLDSRVALRSSCDDRLLQFEPQNTSDVRLARGNEQRRWSNLAESARFGLDSCWQRRLS